jgi:hypothetical protein
VSGVEREADLFFHISEAPVDVELQDEVEFKVKYNQRSEKDIAVQLVRLPKGSIVWEDVRAVCRGIHERERERDSFACL